VSSAPTSPAEVPPVRRRLSSASRRELLLVAALEEFGRRGFHLTQMEHVAAAAGVSKGLLYQHFPSKDELFTAVCVSIVDDFTARFAAAVAEAGTSLARVRAAVRQILDYVTERPAAWSVVLGHLDNPELGVVRERLGSSIAEVMLGRVDDDPKRKAAARRAVALLVPQITGALFGLVAWWLEHPDTPRARVESAAVDFIWLGLERLREGQHAPPRG
jgi:AcrR family transcriptional regulator